MVSSNSWRVPNPGVGVSVREIVGLVEGRFQAADPLPASTPWWGVVLARVATSLALGAGRALALAGALWFWLAVRDVVSR